ncbi:hypothetical protein PLIIFM63780_009788 [Purpureocillium lilacinum]|nr:hypothetical protein PLIIFM63780_009788 [Purpureocillium lilacinum]
MRTGTPLALMGLFCTAHTLKPPVPRHSEPTCETPQYDGVVEVQVIVYETPAGCLVVVETLVERPTVVEVLPGCTLTVTDAPTCITTTLTPTASICSTETISKYTVTSGIERYTSTISGGDGDCTIIVYIVHFQDKCHYNPVNNRHKEHFKEYNIHGQHPRHNINQQFARHFFRDLKWCELRRQFKHYEPQQYHHVQHNNHRHHEHSNYHQFKHSNYHHESTPSPTDACDTIPEQCGSGGGLTVKYYENSIETQAYGIDARTGGLGPDYYLDLEPLGTGMTDTLSVPYFYGADGRRGIYIPAEPAGSNYYPGLTNTFAGITFDANNFTLVFTGYYKAPASGPYTFCADTDNVDNFYIGSVDAFPCGEGNTTKTVPPGAQPLVYNYYGRTSRKTCGTRDLVQGYYYPIRSVFGNWGTPSHLKFTVKPPGGEETSMIGDFGYPSVCDS